MPVYDQEWAEATARMRSDAMRAMEQMVERSARHNAVVAEEAARYLIAFMRRIPWANPLEEEEDDRIVGPVADGETLLARFVVLPAEGGSRSTDHYASWRPTLDDLVVHTFFDPREIIAGSILFHELYHVHDPRTKDPAFRTPSPDGSYPVESDAWGFQSAVLDATVAGRYQEEIHRLADRAEQGSLRHFRRGEFLLPALNPKFMRLFSEKRPPDFCVNTLLLQVQYDLAYERIGRQYGTGPETDQRRAALYTEFVSAVKGPITEPLRAFIREFVDRW